MVTAGIFIATNELESELPRATVARANGISISFASSPANCASFLLDMLSATCGGPRPRLSMLIIAQCPATCSSLIALVIAREPTRPFSSRPKATNTRVLLSGTSRSVR